MLELCPRSCKRGGQSLLRRGRSGRCHPHDRAFHVLVALGVLQLALVPVHLVADGAADNPVDRIDLVFLVGAARVFVLRGRKRQIVLLFLVLLIRVSLAHDMSG